jgi:glutaredoxin 3
MKDVTIYSTTYCGFCARSKDLLRNMGVLFDEVDVTGDDEARERLVQMTGGKRTVPQIWVGETYVGGYMDLKRLRDTGELQQLIFGSAGDSAAAP